MNLRGMDPRDIDLTEGGIAPPLPLSLRCSAARCGACGGKAPPGTLFWFLGDNVEIF
ncbi:hypothetical protein VE00_06362 [Pseudogymnoascus sp. WSF 3629]|nr:hypothetical protein VE00_06362 [Pseudogymnoascus sp. WSF 3629]